MPSPQGVQSDIEQPASNDAAALYGDAQRSFRWRDKLAFQRQKNANSLWNKITHKSANIPLDGETEDMNVTNTDNRRTTTGLGWKELAIIVLGLFGASYCGLQAYDRFNPQPPPAAQPTDPTTDPTTPGPLYQYDLNIRGR